MSAITPQQAPIVGIWQDARVIIVRGPQAADFLQGYLTSNTAELRPGHAQPTALCNVKGRVLANGWAMLLDGAESGVAIVIHASLYETTVRFLTPYVTFSKCELADAPLYVQVVSQAATDSTAGFETSGRCIMLFEDILITLTDQPPADATDVSAFMNQRLVNAGYPLVSTPVSEQFLPQMLALDEHGAVDFNKGCYLGQEIVARAQFRGEVKRRLQTLNMQDVEGAPDIGDTTQGRAVIINLATDGHALAVARLEISDVS